MLLEYHGISTSAICLSFRTGFLWRGHQHRRHPRHLKSLIILMIKARQSALGQSTEGTCTWKTVRICGQFFDGDQTCMQPVCFKSFWCPSHTIPLERPQSNYLSCMSFSWQNKPGLGLSWIVRIPNMLTIHLNTFEPNQQYSQVFPYNQL
jgi:hypothetical protein